jgi:hypothetical protein
VLEPGDTVRIIGTFCKDNNYQISLDDFPIDEKNSILKARFLVYEPEILVPSTGISTAAECARIPLLREQFKNAEGDPNYALILGNVIHLIFQRILENPAGK